jgi:hypothetical protein
MPYNVGVAKTGRNQPCPCGSGKKYKFCCGSGGNIIPFPGTVTEPPAKAPLQEAPWDLMAPTEFPSGFVAQQNDAPDDDFLGLTPSQMYDTLNSGFEENESILSFVPRIEWTDVESVPVLEQALYFLTALEELQPLPATQNGNLPRKFVQRVFEHVVKKRLHPGLSASYKEDDLREIDRLRYVLRYSGLIRKYKKAFSVTRAASKMLRERDWIGIYRKIFHGYSFKYSWAFDDEFPELWIVQHSLIFNLYILKQQAQGFVSGVDLGRTYAKAFPVAVDEAARLSSDPVAVVAECFLTRFVERYAAAMGLVIGEPRSSVIHRSDPQQQRWKTTPLFERILEWGV